MTPKFTTECYVQIADRAKLKEVCDKLQQIGYHVFKAINNPISDTIFTDLFFADGSYTNEPCYAIWKNHMVVNQLPNTHIDCGSNVALFLDLTGMRSDTDLGQWFIGTKGKYKGKMTICPLKSISGLSVCQFPIIGAKHLSDCVSVNQIRRATATEIINYHKQKAEANE